MHEPFEGWGSYVDLAVSDDFSGEDDEFLSETGLVVAFSTNAPRRIAARILGRGVDLDALQTGQCYLKRRGDRVAKKIRAWRSRIVTTVERRMNSVTAMPDYREEGDLVYLRREFSRRTAEVWKRFPFVAFVLVAIVGLGGVGIWAELVKMSLSEDPGRLDGVFTAVAAFYPAVVGSASFQLLLIATERMDRNITAFGVLILTFTIAATVLLSVYYAHYPVTCLIAAVFLAFFSIWLWVVTNVGDPIFQPVSVDAATGGSPSRDPKGDLSAFTAD